ncbi:MAG: diguanylate cyclase, partial [Candidatus Omnitrophota bacterium]
MSDELSFQKNSALLDPLTGLYNRHYLEQFVPQELKKAQAGNYPLSLLMIDVDKFKKINDSYGHLCGDKALKHAAGIMKKTVRQNDTVIRYAGDEFLILLPGADKDTTSAICKNLLSNIEKNQLTIDKDRVLDITLSIGYAVYPEDSGEQLKLIDMADKALYLSKKQGRNRFSSAKEVTVEEVSSLVAMDAFPCRNFIGRREELEKLKQLFDSVAGSKMPQAAFISGPSGVGRSRILDEIKNYVKDKGSLIYCGASSPHAEDPYYLFAKGIGDHIDLSGIDDPRIMDVISKMPAAELSELSLIIPQLRKLAKRSADLNAEDTGRRFLLFEAFSDILNWMADHESVLMIFDDIDWADKASLELLRYLIKHEANRNMFIACSFANRPTGAAAAAALQAMLKETSNNASVSNIALADLSAGDTTTMMDAIFPGISKAKGFAGLIYNTTKGNPYFIEEMLKFLVEKGVIFYQKDIWHVRDGIGEKEIPASLNEIIKVRLTSLDDETKEMMLQAAVIGKNFDADMLKKIGEKNEGFVSEFLARAKNMHLVDGSEGSGKFNFINENTQNILYGELNEAARNKLHYKIAQLLVNEHKDNLYDVAGEAAFHYSHAPGEEKALKSGKELLEKASELFDPDEIRDSLEQFARELASKKEKTIVELSDKAMKEATKFVLFVHGTMKKMRLYPPNSSVRLNTIKEVHQVLNQIFLEVDSLILTEIEKSLVINGRRLSPAEESYAKAGEFLLIMREHGMKTISIKRGMREDELNNLISHFSRTRKEIVDRGGWATVINKEALEHVGIDELHFISVDEYAKASPGKRPLHDFMLMEFLLGKADQRGLNKEEIARNIGKNPQRIAQTIMDMANIAFEKDKTRDDAKIVTDVITKIDSQILEGSSSEEERGKDLAKVIME